MAEWKTCRERCYLEELASADGKITVHRRKGSNSPGERMLKHALAARSELEGEFGKGAFDDIEYDILTYVSTLGGYFIRNPDEIMINIPIPKVPELSDFMTVSYSRVLLEKETAGRLHELYLRGACGEVLGLEDELALDWLMKEVGTAWEESYAELAPRLVRELIRHESTHSLEKNIRATLSLGELKMKQFTPEEFTGQAVNQILGEGFANLVCYDYETAVPPAVGGVFRKRLQKMFKRAKTIDYVGLSPLAVLGERFKRFIRRTFTGEVIEHSASYGKYISGLDPAVLNFAGEYLAGTILEAYGKDAVRKCVTELKEDEILALYFEACSTLDQVSLFDITEYPYFTRRVRRVVSK